MSLTKIISNHPENFLFIIDSKKLRSFLGIFNFTVSGDPEFPVPYIIDEHRYKLKDNYKIELKSIYDGFERHIFYISDLESIIRNGDIKFCERKQL